MRERHGNLKGDGGEKVFQRVAIRVGSREEETRCKLTAFGTCLCHRLCDSGLACTYRPMEPEELRGPGFIPDPLVNVVQHRCASPRMTAGGREPFLRVISGTKGGTPRERLQGEIYPN